MGCGTGGSLFRFYYLGPKIPEIDCFFMLDM